MGREGQASSATRRSPSPSDRLIPSARPPAPRGTSHDQWQEQQQGSQSVSHDLRRTLDNRRLEDSERSSHGLASTSDSDSLAGRYPQEVGQPPWAVQRQHPTQPRLPPLDAHYRYSSRDQASDDDRQQPLPALRAAPSPSIAPMRAPTKSLSDGLQSVAHNGTSRQFVGHPPPPSIHGSGRSLEHLAPSLPLAPPPSYGYDTRPRLPVHPRPHPRTLFTSSSEPGFAATALSAVADRRPLDNLYRSPPGPPQPPFLPSLGPSGHTSGSASSSTTSSSRFGSDGVSLPPLSRLVSSSTPATSSSAPSSSKPMGPPPSTVSHQKLQSAPSHTSLGKKRGWSDMAFGERESAVQGMLYDYMLARAEADRLTRHRGAASLDAGLALVVDRFFVTVSCDHSGVAQKSYGHEKRFLCPPPLVKIRGPGYSSAGSSSSDVVGQLRMSILPGPDNTSGATTAATAGDHHRDGTASYRASSSSLGGDGTIITEEASLDRSHLAKFGHLHVGGTSSGAKTFRLQLDLLKTNTLLGPERSMASLQGAAASSRGARDLVQMSGSGPSQGFRRPGDVQSSMLPGAETPNGQRPYLTLTSSLITVISKPSKKTSKAKTSSSQITPALAICLFNRVNSQNVRTKYMAVDEGRLSARSDTWSTFIMRPYFASGRQADGRDIEPVLYGSVVMLEAPGFGAVSEPMVVCKVERGKIVLPASVTSGGTKEKSADRTLTSTATATAEGPISQMQKVAFMRYDPTAQQTPRSPTRSFLCAASIGAWWRSSTTAPAATSPPVDGQGAEHQEPQQVPSRSSSESQSGDSSEPSPRTLSSLATGPNTTLPTTTSATTNGGADGALPTPLTFMSAGVSQADGDDHSTPSSGRYQDLGNDAFCWSIVGAARFEHSFLRLDDLSSSSQQPPLRRVDAIHKMPSSHPHSPLRLGHGGDEDWRYLPSGVPGIGTLPKLPGQPLYRPDSHSIDLTGESLFTTRPSNLATPSSSSANLSAVVSLFEVWVGSLGPLPLEVFPSLGSQGGKYPPGGPVLNAALPSMDELVHYAQSLTRAAVNSRDFPAVYDRATGRSGIPASSSRFETSGDLCLPLPLSLVRPSDGTVCRSVYQIELLDTGVVGSDKWRVLISMET